MQKQTEMLTARISKQLRRTLRRQARRIEKRSEGEIVRDALENYFAQNTRNGGAAAPEQKTPVRNDESLTQAV